VVFGNGSACNEVKVGKLGRSTEVTQGEICHRKLNVCIRENVALVNNTQQRVMTKEYGALGTLPNGAFAMRGDSGARVNDRTFKDTIVGKVVAAVDAGGYVHFTVVSPIKLNFEAAKKALWFKAFRIL